jgi:hypothetical protein
VPTLSTRRFASLCLFAFLLFPRIAAAQDQRAVLELIVNRVPAGESVVVLRGADALVPVEALQNAGLRGFEGRRDTLGGQELVSLLSLSPRVSFTIDEIDLRLTLNASPDLLGRTVRDLWSRAPADLVYRKDTSSYVNYSANWHSNRNFDLFAESATSVRGMSIYNTVSANREKVTRGLTSVTLDQRRWRPLRLQRATGWRRLDRRSQRHQGIRDRPLLRPLPDVVAVHADCSAFGHGGLRQRPGRQPGARGAGSPGHQKRSSDDGTQ